ncbi:hypothetical protein PYR78_06370 [Acinetobacter johnsonii]|nr:hypothetical protein PYR78_06370 [Acinetobacter johnsonii]
MDIQKEREAFEKHASKFFTDSKEAFKTNGDQYLYDEVIWMWDCWIERAKAQAVPEVINVGNELQSWVAVWSFKARHDREDYIVVDANLLADKIEKLTGANA